MSKNRERLLSAVIRDDEKEVRQIFDTQEVSEKDASEAFLIAAKKGNIEMVKYLLQRDIDVN
jgi:hypothetical protein